MADYHSPTVVQPTISSTDMTALERLLLTHIFESAPDGDGLYFFAETSPKSIRAADRNDPRRARGLGRRSQRGRRIRARTIERGGRRR